MVTKIECGLMTVDYIIHVADIHIRNWKRHGEYREVFEQLYNLVSKAPTNTIVTVGGDIVHAKTDMSPELIDMVNDFFVNLSNIAPTFIICGNHDTNLNNNNRLDALSPIIKVLKQPNLYYLKDTGLYEVGDVCLSVMSLLQPADTYIKAKDIEGAYKRKFALYHGTVENSSTDTGIKLLQGLPINVFDDYDVALLGDIHKRQVLKQKPYIFYPGSLIQQNFGEDYEGHGAAILDVNTLECRFIDLPNRYGFYTLEILDGEIPDNLPITSKTNVRLKVKNTSQAQLKRVLATLRKDYSINEPTINYLDGKDAGRDVIDFNSGDVRRVEYQNELIREYLTDKNLDEETLVQIYEINKQFNAGLPHNELVRNVIWNPKKFEFSNMFSYGEDNVVNFSNMNGLCGLFAANHTGKSAMLDALCFCLFDHSFRATKAEHVLNNKSDWFHCKFSFELNGHEYFIEKKATRYQKGPLAGKLRVDINFWYISEEGEKVSLNGEQRRDTDKNIQSYIGTFDDFILTALSLQNNNSNFIDKTQGERKELLANFLDLTIFDQLYELANKENRSSSMLLEEYQKQDFETKLGDAEKSKELFEQQYTIVQEKLDLVKQDVNQHTEQVLKLTKKIKHTKADGLNITLLEKNKKDLELETISKEKKANILREELQSLQAKQQEQAQKILAYDATTLHQNYKEYINKLKNKQELDIQLEQLKLTTKSKLEKLERLQKHEYDPNCKYCVDNVFVKDAIDTKKQLEDDKELVMGLLNTKKQVELYLEDNKQCERDYDDYNKIVVTKQGIDNTIALQKSKLTTISSEIQNLQLKLENIEQSIKLYHDNEKDIKHNTRIQEEINNINKALQEAKAQENNYTKELQQLHGNVAVSDVIINDALTSIKHMQQLADKQVAYNHYMSAMSKDGIPFVLITKAIPFIQNYVNTILSQVTEFTLLFETDGKYINVFICYDTNKWPLELSSGMERFISSLAIRIALIKITNLPKPNFIALDEGLGVLDSTNLNSMHMLFTHIKTLFKHALVISHIDVVRDMVDTILTIDRAGDFSYIKYE